MREARALPGRGFDLPALHVVALVLTFWVGAIGGTITIGTWGDLDARLAIAYLVPAILLHLWATLARPPRRAPRIAAWVLVAAMCVHTQVLLRPEVLAPLALLAVLDAALHPGGPAPRPKLPLRARAGAAAAALLALAAVGLLAVYANTDAMVRLSAVSVLAASIAIAAALVPRFRAPTVLLPALGVHYLVFVLVAAPAIPFGPAVAWWLLCLSVVLGAMVSARHVSGHELPPGQRRHRQVVRALPDPALAAAAGDVEAYLGTGSGARELALRAQRARGLEPDGEALHLTAAARGEPPRAAREAALRRLLEMTE